MPKITVTITKQELNQIVAQHFGLTQKIELIIEESGNQEDNQNKQDDWIPWSGGKNPVDGGTKVEVKLRNGVTGTGYSDHWSWYHNYHKVGDIVAYRVVKE